MLRILCIYKFPLYQ